MDDIGLNLAKKENPGTQKFGRFLVQAMPKLLAGLSVVGTFAMLWVGGHIILVGTDELGLHILYDIVHNLEEPAAMVSRDRWIPRLAGQHILLAHPRCHLGRHRSRNRHGHHRTDEVRSQG